MSYSLVLYFCRIALRCFGMLLTPACIRKTVSGPYPKRQLVFEPATEPNLRELCQSVHLSVHLACQTLSTSKISTESQLSNLPKLISNSQTSSPHLAPHLYPSPPWHFRHSRSCRAPARAPPIDQARCQWYVWPPGVVRGGKWQLSSDGNMKLTWK